jgi:hypothetical protein
MLNRKLHKILENILPRSLSSKHVLTSRIETNQRSENHHNSNETHRSEFLLFGMGIGAFILLNEKVREARAEEIYSTHIQFKELARKRYALQYAANSPIEDRILCGQLNSVVGEVLAVFDGHGGYSIGILNSRLCSSKLIG